MEQKISNHLGNADSKVTHLINTTRRKNGKPLLSRSAALDLASEKGHAEISAPSEPLSNPTVHLGHATLDYETSERTLPKASSISPSGLGAHALKPLQRVVEVESNQQLSRLHLLFAFLTRRLRALTQRCVDWCRSSR